jgi:hypothetical protein
MLSLYPCAWKEVIIASSGKVKKKSGYDDGVPKALHIGRNFFFYGSLFAICTGLKPGFIAAFS